MGDVTQQINQFQQFALARLQNSQIDLSIDELYDEWRQENPDPEVVERDVKAVAASLRDLEQGIQSRSAGEFVREFKAKSNLE